MASAIYVEFDPCPPAPTGYSVYASAQYGDDGPGNGPDPEVDVGNGDGGSYGRDTWDAPPLESDGSFNSGWLPTQLVVNPGDASDAVQWDVAGDNPDTLDCAGSSSGPITSVELVAGVQTTATAEFGEVTIEFLKNGTVEDTWTGDGPSVTTSDPAAPSAEQDVVVTPGVADANSVIVRGNIHFAAPAGVYPGPNDMYAEVFVNAKS